MRGRLRYGLVLAATLVGAIVVPVSSAPAEVTLGQQIADPSYINPTGAPQLWNQLLGSSPGSVGIVMANVLNGPDYVAKSEWSSVIERAHSAGMKVLGYVDSGYFGTTVPPRKTREGSTTKADWMAQAEQDVNAWYSFYGSDLGGIFFDDGQNQCGANEEGDEWATLYRELSQYVKKEHPGALTVANPGIAVPQCYENSADTLVTFEGSISEYLSSFQPLTWTENPEKAWHLVYGAGSQGEMENAIALSKGRHAGYVFLTNGVQPNPYDTLPPANYWSAEQAAVAPGLTGSTPPSVPGSLTTEEVGSTYVKLKWNASSGVSSPVAAYDIFQNGAKLASVGANKTSYIAPDLDASNGYKFQVDARDVAGNVSAPTGGLSVETLPTNPSLPSAPSGLSSSGTTYTSTVLTWGPSSVNEGVIAKYHVYANGNQIMVLSGTMLGVTVGDLAPGSSTTLTVKAEDDTGGYSAASNPVTVSTAALPGGQEIANPGVEQGGGQIRYGAEFFVPFGFRHVFIATNASKKPHCWGTGSSPSFCANYMIENETLFKYAGSGTDFTWSPIKTIQPNINGYRYSWTVNASEIGSPALETVSFNGSGYAPENFTKPVSIAAKFNGPVLPGEESGGGDPSEPRCQVCNGDPVNSATGELAEQATDVSVPGRGAGLQLQRAYSSGLAGTSGPFGNGWSDSYSMSVAPDPTLGETVMDVRQETGAMIRFTQEPNGSWAAPSRVQATLVHNENGSWTFVRQRQTTFTFNSSGQLTSEADLNGNTTSFTYNGSGQLTGVTDAAGRKLTLSYSGEQVSQVTDPLGHTVSYRYDAAGDLTEVTNMDGAVTKYAYNANHLMTSLTDPRGGTTTTSYDESGRVISQKDPLGRETKWSYSIEEATLSGTVSITNPRGEVTQDTYNEGDLVSEVRGSGTSAPSTTTYTYDPTTNAIATMTDPDGHVTSYSHDSFGDKTSETDPAGNITKWSYDSHGLPVSTTPPNGNATTIERDEHGNAISVSRPAPASQTQTTKYAYDSHGDATSMTNPLGRVWKYEYDNQGDRTAETDPEGDKRTWRYNEDSQEISTTSPRGNLPGAEAVQFTTTVERDALGRPILARELLGGAPTFSEALSSYDNPEVRLSEPNALAIDPSANIWVVEGGRNHVLELNSGHKFLRQLGEEGSGASQFKGIGGIAVASAGPDKGDVYVTDSGNNRIQEFGPAGEHLNTFGSASLSGGQLLDPIGIAIDSSGNIWVANYIGGEGDRIVEFSAEGKELAKFGVNGSTGEGKLGNLSGLAISGENLYVTEEENSRVQKLSMSSAHLGKFEGQFDEKGSGNGKSNKPYAIATEAGTGNLYVSEIGNNRVQEFSPAGEFMTAFGSPGTGTGDFSGPKGLAIGSSGTIYVADTGNNRVEEWTGSPLANTASLSSYDNPEVRLSEPNALAIDPSANIWVVEGGRNHVLELNSGHKFLRQLGEEGSGASQFKGIGGIAVASAGPDKGDVYVTDSGNNRIQEFGPAGEHLNTFGSASLSGGQLLDPIGIAIDSSGNIWVANYIGGEGDRIVEFSAEGKELAKFGVNGSTGEGKLGNLSGLAISGENLYVTEEENSRVQKLSMSSAHLGKFEGQFDEKGSGNGKSNKPYAIATEAGTGNLYVSEIGNNRVQEFSPAGEFMTAFGSPGTGTGDFSGPKGLAIGSSGTIYVADTGNNRVEEWTPSAHVTKYSYDADGNLATQTNPDGRTTSYVYDADNEPTKVTGPGGAISETTYDPAGEVVSQTDADKHTTTYVRNLLEEVTEAIDPLERKTTKEYDKAGNLTSLTDAEGHTTSYSREADNRITKVAYSDGKTPTIEYAYNADGDRTTMIDASGTSTYTYDQLDRLTEAKDGHGDTVSYEYNLAGAPTKITYPNGKAVERSYDSDGRLSSVKDWLGHTTSFSYDADSDLSATSFPSETGDSDHYAYNSDDQIGEVSMRKGESTLASLSYGRDAEGQATTVASKGLPGEENMSYTYNEETRLTKAGGTTYEYDAAGNLTKIGSTANTYDAADELTASGSNSYSYSKDGRRIKTSGSGPETTYGYDQAGNLISVSRPEEGSHAKIEDSYTYNGSGLRASQTVSSSTSYLSWDIAEPLPLLLNDGANSYIYGPTDAPIEQISTAGSVFYLHHDPQGSTRLLTGSSGAVSGSSTYDAYGNLSGSSGSAASALGFDGQLTSSDTGLLYLRARSYDPATGQFTTVDPLETVTGAPYSFANDNPQNDLDPTGLMCSLNPIGRDNCFSDVPKALGGAIVSGAEWAAEHPGLVLGGISLGTGFGDVVVGGDLTLTAISGITATAATGVDTDECIRGNNLACIGAGGGLAGAAGSVAGLTGGAAREIGAALGLPTATLGTAADAGGAATASPSPSDPLAGVSGSLLGDCEQALL